MSDDPRVQTVARVHFGTGGTGSATTLVGTTELGQLASDAVAITTAATAIETAKTALNTLKGQLK